MKRAIWTSAALSVLAAAGWTGPALADGPGVQPATEMSFVDGSVIPTNPAQSPWGDVNADGLVTSADADMVQAYLANPNGFTAAQRERIRRYGDVNGTINRSTIGNAVVDGNDVQRAVLLGSGVIDAGTAGAAPAGYGDVNGDGRCDLVDATLVQRARNGKVPNATIDTAIRTRGRGDISPTIPFISFGDGAITVADEQLIRQRATGTEANAPVYLDYWPLHAPTADNPEVIADRYTFTDITLNSGDAMGQATFLAQTPVETRGYTVTEMRGTDGSLAGVFKGQDGGIYAVYLKYPQAFGNNLMTFQTPIKLLDMRAVRGETATWGGWVEANSAGLGPRPAPYTGTLLAESDVYTPAAGMYPSGTPASAWSRTIRVRLDVALLKGPLSQVEMQQAFFFDFTPFIGMVQRGQAGVQGSAAPTLDRPFLMLDQATVRGRSYRQTAP